MWVMVDGDGKTKFGRIKMLVMVAGDGKTTFGQGVMGMITARPRLVR